MKTKKKRASILAVTMIILGIMLITAMSVSIVSIKERKASMGEAKSGQAFQNSQSGVELVMQAIAKSGISEVNQIAGKVIVSGSPAQCNSDSGDIVGAEGYAVRLLEEDGVTQIRCDASSRSISDVASIKSVGTGSGQQRAIEAAAVCAGADIDSDIIGWWKFDSDGDYKDYSGFNNDAEACTSLNYTSLDPPIITVDSSSPKFKSDPIRSSFISFNNAGTRNCATIKHNDRYKLQNGTVSFWFKYRGNPLGTDSVSLFVKDANACDTRTDPSDVSADYGSSSSNYECDPTAPTSNPPYPVGDISACDCGHLGFRFNYPTNFKFGVRFQNDGNGGFYALVNDSSPVLDWSEWHSAILTFTSEKYVLYIDGKEHSTFESIDPTDDKGIKDPDAADGFEALMNNDWNIFLGIGYPDSSGVEVDDEANWLRQLNDMDELRIYERALTQCEVTKLYLKTKDE